MSERAAPSLRMKLLLAAQLGVALLFWLMAWDHTVSLAQGRPARTLDVVAMALPLIATIVLGAAALWLARRGRRDWARAAVLAPFPLAIVLFSLLGAI